MDLCRMAGQNLVRLGVGSALVCTMPALHEASAQQPNCGPADVILEALSRDHGERQIASFLDQRGTLMRLLVNAETRSWTLLALGPSGQACLIGFGEAFEPEMPSVDTGRSS